ncbi:MAG: hypothetical protein JST67_06295 [Bacteroidetes bacterium]|nr:hypothetical protein [Bacteroidota bacterium]
MRFFAVFVFIFLCVADAFSQCTCSSCMAPGTTTFGVLEKGDLMAFGFFKRNYSDTYFEGDKRTHFNYLSNDFSDYSGINVSYGVTNKFTVQASLGYYINKIENFNIPIIGQQQLSANGLADAEIYAKYNVFQAKSGVFSLTLSGGAKLPTGKYNMSVNNVELTRDVQPGAGAYSGVLMAFMMLKPFKKKPNLFILFNTRVDFNGVNPQGYQYGTGNTNTLSTTIKIYKQLSFIAMFRNENHDFDKVNNLRLYSSSSIAVFATPGVSINLGHDISFACYADLPMYQYYHGIQLAAKYAYSFAISKIFELHKPHIPEEEK